MVKIMSQINQIFINEAMTNAIKRYLDNQGISKSNDSLHFGGIVMKILVLIYGELDIINSYKTQNEHGLGGFNKNLMKYGYPLNRINLFKSDFQNYYDIEKKNSTQAVKIKNPFYVLVQKHLIDMFFKKVKRLNLDEKAEQEFYKLLFTDDSSNSYVKSYNLLVSPVANAVRKYFEFKKYQQQNQITYKLVKDNVLVQEIYSFFAIDEEIVNAMTQKQLDNVNSQIYDYLETTANDPKLPDKIKKAINGKSKPNITIKY